MKKFLLIIVSIILILLLVFLLKFVLIKDKQEEVIIEEIDVRNIEIDNKVDSIVYNIIELDSVIYNIKREIEYDNKKILEFDGCSTVMLFYELVESE